MHYYKRNLGDYAKKAGRLSMLQHGAYTLLIDACYDREQFPTIEEAFDWTWASSAAEIEAVEFVLSRFFTLENGRYVQPRIREEIEEYQEKAAVNKRIAIEREVKRRENNTNRARYVNEPPPNQEPLTNNQEPITNNQEPKTKIKPATKSPAISIQTFIKNCSEKNEEKIPKDDPVFDFAENNHIPLEMLRVCWAEFVRRSTESRKRQADWRMAFRNCVYGNWYKLWFVEADGSVKETSQYRTLRKHEEVQNAA